MQQFVDLTGGVFINLAQVLVVTFDEAGAELEAVVTFDLDIQQGPISLPLKQTFSGPQAQALQDALGS